MPINISALPWLCAIADEDGRLRETNGVWRVRFGDFDEFALCLPDAMAELRAVTGENGEATNAPPAFFDRMVRSPGELAPFLLRFAALNAEEIAKEKSQRCL